MSACLRSAVIDTDLIPSTIDDSRRSETAAFDPRESDHRPIMPNAYDRALVEPIEIRSCDDIVRRHPLPAAHPSSFGCCQGQRRDAVQRGLDWQQVPRSAQTMPTLDCEIQRYRPL